MRREGRTGVRTAGRLAAAALALCAFAGQGAHAQQRPLEYPVKAAFLHKFGAFVGWPSAALGPASEPMTVCVVGPDPFGPALDQAVRGQKVGGRSLRVERHRTVSRGAGCHILYLRGSSAQSVADGLAVTAGAPVLTVTDAADGNARGVIHFVVVGGRVRFEIDDRAAARNGLTVSSKLLSLAVHVRPRER
ncbi:MAG TPA: YfiR family protein [Caulobacteraceae bacterium]|nr:YfiR family protein [Caulobacteraceae bacterium]